MLYSFIDELKVVESKEVASDSVGSVNSDIGDSDAIKS